MSAIRTKLGNDSLVSTSMADPRAETTTGLQPLPLPYDLVTLALVIITGQVRSADVSGAGDAGPHHERRRVSLLQAHGRQRTHADTANGNVTC